MCHNVPTSHPHKSFYKTKLTLILKNTENSVMLVLIKISHAVKLTYFSIILQYCQLQCLKQSSCDPDNKK